MADVAAAGADVALAATAAAAAAAEAVAVAVAETATAAAIAMSMAEGKMRERGDRREGLGVCRTSLGFHIHNVATILAQSIAMFLVNAYLEGSQVLASRQRFICTAERFICGEGQTEGPRATLNMRAHSAFMAQGP